MTTTTQQDREHALLVLADEGRTKIPDPQDVLAILDFLAETDEKGL